MLRIELWRGVYHDSLTLMRVARAVQDQPGVSKVAALMGTPANLDVLTEAGFPRPPEGAGPGDLILAVEGDSEAVLQAAIASVPRLLEERHPTQASGIRPRTVTGALEWMPDASLAVISVPGAYAKREAMAALSAGLHVLLFSDNVSIEDEVELKRTAVARDLLCMGPDCGTAYIDGIGLGFANVVPRGSIGCVAASGSGLQAVAVELATLGDGVSEGIGVGGRDLSRGVDGLMTIPALARLGADPETRVIVVIGKSLDRLAARRLRVAAARNPKPIVGCFVRPTARIGSFAAQTSVFEDAAGAAVAILRGLPRTSRPFTEPQRVSSILSGASGRIPSHARLVGLFVGGSLAAEALMILRSELGPVRSNLDGLDPSSPHEVVDLGADDFTRGRPHPMFDPVARTEAIERAAGDLSVGVILVDVVLGRGAHQDPAGVLARAVMDARERGRGSSQEILVVASVIGTDADPQSRRAQAALLEKHGVFVLPTSAQAARFAARVLQTSRSAGGAA
jgi:FdrA protein